MMNGDASYHGISISVLMHWAFSVSFLRSARAPVTAIDSDADFALVPSASASLGIAEGASRAGANRAGRGRPRAPR
jgi:hypothetical protein